MSATSTHDTKRGEDVRARINVLSEMPGEWYRAIRRWQEMNRRWKTKAGDLLSPGRQRRVSSLSDSGGDLAAAADELRRACRIYASAFSSTWKRRCMRPRSTPVGSAPTRNTIRLYSSSSRTFWMPSAGNAFLDDFQQFQAPIAKAGIWNSIAQVLLKVASPGVPDFYQGNELWCFDLVDPDNRRPVDFELRRQMLGKMREQAGQDRAALVDRFGFESMRWRHQALHHQRGARIAQGTARFVCPGFLYRLDCHWNPRESCGGIRPQSRTARP